MAVLDCNNKNQTTEELIRDLITVDDQDRPALRVVNSVDTGVGYVACNNKDMTLEQLLISVIVQDTNGKPAINLAEFP